jgi:hypothetical protein
MSASPTPDHARAHPRVHWLPGDYAECVHEGPWFLRGIKANRDGPGSGEVHKIRKVVVATSPWTGRATLMLTFDRRNTAYPATSFRKAPRPGFRARTFGRMKRRRSGAPALGRLAIVSAVCSGLAAAVLQVLGSDR